MLNRLITLSIFIVSIFSVTLKSQYKSEVYSAYVNNKMDQWKRVIDRMETGKVRYDETILELINYQYGYIGYCIEFDKTADAKKYFSLANNNIEKIEKKGYNLSTLNSYKAAFYGFRISFNKFTAPLNGPKSLDHAKIALKQDSSNYLANIQYGYALYNMPEVFGGSKAEALKYYLRAKNILEKNPELTKQNWNYMNLLILIGRTYANLQDYASAKVFYEKVLTLEPGFLYVRDELYPKLMEKMKK
jgi:tetratricopeptide (TPR) repeat protein